MNSRGLIFLGHDGRRTGAPINLLHLLRWLKEQTQAPASLVLRVGGDLVPYYEACCPVSVMRQPDEVPRSRWSPVWRALGLPRRCWPDRRGAILRAIRRAQPQLIYANSIVSCEELEDLHPLNCPIILHVHELDCSIRYGVGDVLFRKIADRADRVIAASTAVAECLTGRYGIANEKVRVVHEFIQPPVTSPEIINRHRHEVREELGLAPDTFLVGGCGTIDWRKGTDLFLLLAGLMRSRGLRTPVRFAWVGTDFSKAAFSEVLARDHKLGKLTDEVRFVGLTVKPERYLAALDAFALMSREDPFPLAMLEAAAWEVPVVCFDQAGGAPEFVEADAGVVVPYLDLNAMADSLIRLASEPDRRRALGRAGARKVIERFTIAEQAPRIWRVIEECLAR